MLSALNAIVHQTVIFFPTEYCFELAGLNALHVRTDTTSEVHNFLSLELGIGHVLSFANRTYFSARAI